MEKYKKATIVSFAAYLSFIVLILFHEVQILNISRQQFITKVTLLLAGVALLSWLKRSPWSYFANMGVGIHFLVFSVLGQLHSPFYFLYYQILMIAYSFLFPVDRKVFKALMVFGSMIFCSVFVLTYDETVKELLNPESKKLFVISIFASVIVSYLSYLFFTSDRTIKNDLLRRFSIVGLQTAQVVHDIKNSMFTPLMTVEILKNKAKSTGNADIIELCDSLESQLSNMKNLVEPLNRISAVQTGVATEVRLIDIIEDTKKAMSASLKNIDLTVSGQCLVLTEEASLKAVIFNLMQNSIDQFRRERITNPKISFICTAGEFTYRDNGGGFTENKLKELNEDQYSSGHGSALGLFVVVQTLVRLEAAVKFGNLDGGVHISVRFKANDKSVSI